MAIKLDEDNKVVVYENEPDEPRRLFPNLQEGGGSGEGGVQDVLINGTSIVDENGDANIPAASTNRLGVSKVSSDYGTGVYEGGGNILFISGATAEQIKNSRQYYKPIVPDTQHLSTFYGIAKAAGDTTQALSDNEVGNYTDGAKKAIRKMLGIPNATWEKIKEFTVEENSEAVELATDNNGLPFKLSKLYVRVSLPPATTSTADNVGAAVLVKLINDTDTSAPGTTQKYTTGGAATFMEYISELVADRCITQGRSGGNTATTSPVSQASSIDDRLCASITGFRLSQFNASSTLIPQGTHIEVYGIRIDE